MLRHLVILILLFIISSSSVLAFEAKSVELNKDWEYRWGDSPRDETSFLWLHDGDNEAWGSIDFPSNPPGRDHHNNIWYRLRLPTDPDLGHSIFISSIDLIAEFYLDGELLYQYGQFKEDGSGTFKGSWRLKRYR